MSELLANHPYPDHLYDPTRKEISIQLIEKEMSKLLPGGVNQDAVRTWMSELDDHTFWNAVEGFMGGALIKPIVHFITAENYTWSKQDISLSDIQLSSKLQQLESIEGLDTNPPFLSEIHNALTRNPEERQRQLDSIKAFDRGTEQNQYPILAVERGNGFMVMDGNRRCLRALLMGEKAISAWCCQTNHEQPRNFWYPIDDMMRLVKTYNALKDTDPAIKPHIQAVLNGIFTLSAVAKQAYEKRIVAAGTPGAQELVLEVLENGSPD